MSILTDYLPSPQLATHAPWHIATCTILNLHYLQLPIQPTKWVA